MDQHQEHQASGHHFMMVRFIVSLLATLPIILYADLLTRWLKFKLPLVDMSPTITALLGSVVFFYGGGIFLVAAVEELKNRLPGMMTLISLASIAAYSYSLVAWAIGRPTLFLELATLITVMLAGHLLEMAAVRRARGAVAELASLLPETAEIISGTGTTTVPLSRLRLDDLVLVKPGSRLPADGVVKSGQSLVDEAIITGESKPVVKQAGSEVIAGTINGDGSLIVRVTKIGADTFLAGIKRLVTEAEKSKSRLQILADRAARYLTIIAIGAGIVTFGGWLLAGAGVVIALEHLVAVLVIACPHALGLAVPLVAAISTNLAARRGFLIRRRLAFEAARRIGVVLFDKTGTLTTGRYGVVEIIPAKESTADELLALAAAANAHSEHHLAEALLTEAKRRGLVLAVASAFSRLPGQGVRANVGGKTVLVGSEAILTEVPIAVLAAIRPKLDRLSREGKTTIHVIGGGTYRGSIALADVIRPESKPAIRALKNLGVKVAMITGDTPEVAAWVAKELAIDEYFARVLPATKALKVKELKARGLTVAMVGDGINDAPALAEADLGIAIGAGTNVAIESAGIILIKNDPRDISKIISLSRQTYRKMLENLWWASGYNIIALPLAAGVLAWRGISLNPGVAAALMSLSTVIVALNALALRRYRL